MGEYVKWTCPNCRQNFAIPRDKASRVARMTQCRECSSKSNSGDDLEEIPNARSVRQTAKTCPYCSEQVAPAAVKCKHCGSYLLAELQYIAGSSRNRNWSHPAAVTVPILISGISNILIGVLWLISLWCFPIGLLQIAFAIFEFITFAGAKDKTPDQLYSVAGTIGALEIAVGLFNWIGLVCGIIVLCSKGQLLNPRQ